MNCCIKFIFKLSILSFLHKVVDMYQNCIKRESFDWNFREEEAHTTYKIYTNQIQNIQKTYCIKFI